MKKKTVSAILVLAAALGLSAACSGGANTAATPNGTSANAAVNASITSAGHSGTAKTDDETPASVKAAFPEAQSFSKQHKDIAKDAAAQIEKDAGAKVPDADHHSYLAFSTGGARKHLGAATIVKADGKDVVIVYDNKNGSPVIREVRAENVPAPFLTQFAGKGHDDKFAFGSAIKANGADESLAKAITSAIAVDVLTMQALYGASHSH